MIDEDGGFAERTVRVRADMLRYPHVITLPLESTAEDRLYWCLRNFGRWDSKPERWTYWNEKYVGGEPDNVMYMFSDPNHAVLFKLRWAGAKR